MVSIVAAAEGYVPRYWTQDDDHVTPISFPNPNSEIIIQNLNRDLMNQSVYLHSTISTLQKDSNINESLAESIRDSAYEKMCEKLDQISLMDTPSYFLD